VLALLGFGARVWILHHRVPVLCVLWHDTGWRTGYVPVDPDGGECSVVVPVGKYDDRGRRMAVVDRARGRIRHRGIGGIVGRGVGLDVVRVGIDVVTVRSDDGDEETLAVWLRGSNRSAQSWRAGTQAGVIAGAAGCHCNRRHEYEYCQALSDSSCGMHLNPLSGE
jgi:hypothetical protein